MVIWAQALKVGVIFRSMVGLVSNSKRHFLAHYKSTATYSRTTILLHPPGPRHFLSSVPHRSFRRLAGCCSRLASHTLRTASRSRHRRCTSPSCLRLGAEVLEQLLLLMEYLEGISRQTSL